ncbi:hypothetical protein BKA61DRAFT_646888 [Leptodontidium sp. MPI-SDFR-AT-0119]|nr:hypothetical protein BKA61DRAFT_646888 [Leptodontidium sp. MPI-SDFR-AT-0119]
MLGNVPSYLGYDLIAFQDQSKKPEFNLHTKNLSNGLSVLYVNGDSLWNVGEGDCDLKEKTMSTELLLGATIILPIGQCSRSITRQNQENGNCLAILIFAWSYILSARWVEMQQTSGKFAAQSNDRMVYLCDQVGWRDDTSESLLGTIDVNLGDACIDAVRWWAAILAKGEGWRAEIERNGNVYRSPWSTTSNSADHQFRLTRASTSQSSFDSVLSPPSSEVALGYLTDFCLHHNAGGQCSAALASALTFPSLTAASLPLPSSHERRDTSGFKLLPYYMTLSCSRRGIESLLCNTFFDPHIPCNLVSAWIQPIFEVLDPLIARKDYHVLAMVLGRQQPKAAGLWAGAIITGMARSILQHCRNGFIAIDTHSAAWTNTTQTFMSLAPRPLPDCDRIYRSDECRLLYLAGEELNSRIPICPWSPFGTTALSDTDICVRTHANCAAGHFLRYAGWSWALKVGANVRDPGFCGDTTKQCVHITLDDTIVLDTHEETALVSETSSEMATRSIFGWLRSYGWPATEKAIHSHSWIISEESDDESDDNQDDDGVLAHSRQTISGSHPYGAAVEMLVPSAIQVDGAMNT